MFFIIFIYYLHIGPKNIIKKLNIGKKAKDIIIILNGMYDKYIKHLKFRDRIIFSLMRSLFSWGVTKILSYISFPALGRY